MKNPLIIFVGGLARAGKNTLCDILQEELRKNLNLKSTQLAFAHQLRLDVEDFASKCGVNVFDDKEKEVYRLLLLWYGNLKRRQTRGNYFIDKLDRKIKLLNTIYPAFLVSDLRYKAYDYDELDYAKKNGVVVHVSKFKIVGHLADDLGYPIKEYDIAPNEYEAKNDPIIKANADYLIDWEDSGGDIEKLRPWVLSFIDKLKEDGRL